MSYCKQKILFCAHLMVQGGGRCKQVREVNLKAATIPDPEISRNFRTVGGRPQGRGIAPAPKPASARAAQPAGQPLLPQSRPPPAAHPTLADPRTPGSPACSRPLCEYQPPLTSLASDVHVKEDSGVTGVGGLRSGGRVRHFDLQTPWEAASGTSWLRSSWTQRAALSGKTWRRR